MSALLPCPFCGGTDIDVGFHDLHLTSTVQCQQCFARGPQVPGLTDADETEAARLWNCRGDALEPVRAPLADHVPGERPTSDYSEMAIAVARAEGKLRVDKDGLGWISGIEADREAKA